MNKIVRNTLAAVMAGGLLLGTAATAGAEPLAQPDSATQVEMALLGPDRQPRAPQRAVKAPVRRTETRRTQTTVTPPEAPVRPFVYEQRECKPLTDVVYDLQGEDFFCYYQGQVYHYFDDGEVTMWTPEGRFVVNRLGAMGADREFMRPEFGQRLGVWANGRIADDSPRTIVASMVERIKGITCGLWTGPYETTVAGVPVTMATGVDEYANFQYEVIAWERFGNTYALASRIPYDTRYNVERNAELAWIVTHMHPTDWVE